MILAIAGVAAAFFVAAIGGAFTFVGDVREQAGDHGARIARLEDAIGETKASIIRMDVKIDKLLERRP
jgi:molybdopterin synthase catalytic subunit